MTCPRCNADGDHIAEHSNVAECGACGYQWSPRRASRLQRTPEQAAAQRQAYLRAEADRCRARASSSLTTAGEAALEARLSWLSGSQPVAHRESLKNTLDGASLYPWQDYETRWCDCEAAGWQWAKAVGGILRAVSEEERAERLLALTEGG
jgi:hypothetical protein